MSKIAVDIGASFIKIGIIGIDIYKPSILIRTPPSPTQIISVITSAITNLAKEQSLIIEAVGIGCPGLIKSSGLVKSVKYLPLSGLNLKKLLENNLQVEVSIINDAKIQALGFVEEKESFLYVVFGTSIGGAIISNGNLLMGNNGFAGEVGFIPYPVLHNSKSNYERLFLDEIASGWALEDLFERNWWEKPLNEFRKNHLEEVGVKVGKSIALLLLFLDFDKAIIAGHLTEMSCFSKSIKKEIDKYLMNQSKISFINETWPSVHKGVSKILK